MKKVDLCGGSPVLGNAERGKDSFKECPNLDHCSIIVTGKMSFPTFMGFATTDITRRIESISDDRKTVISNKLNAIPNQIIDNPDYLGRGRIPQSMQGSLAEIHGLITYWKLKEATTIIELAIWKWKLNDETPGHEDVGSRGQVRMQCGREMQAIMSGVLQFFEYKVDEE